MISGKFHFATFFVQFGLFILQFILSLIQEPKSPYHFTGDVSVFSLSPSCPTSFPTSIYPPLSLSFSFPPYFLLSLTPSFCVFFSFKEKAMSWRICPILLSYNMVVAYKVSKFLHIFIVFIIPNFLWHTTMIACAGPVYQNNVKNINVHVVSAFKLYVLCILFNT